MDRVQDELFEQLYSEYNRVVYNYIYMSIKDQWKVEDLTSEVFIKVYRHRDKINDVQKSGKWLITIARNTLIDYYRKSYKEEPCEEIFLEGVDEFGYEDVIIKDEFASVRNLIMLMPEDVRKMIVMRYYYGMKFKEIGQKMNLTENAVKCRVSRTIKKLHDMVPEREKICC